VSDIALFVDRQNPSLVEILEDVSEAQHDDLVRNDHHAHPRIMQRHGIEQRPESQDDVRPALAAR
jgi:hypothetical protein